MEVFFHSFIVPVLIVLVLSGVFAFALAFFGTKFSVDRDPRIDEVLSRLAGANCGGCGYAGCDAYACALVEGKAKIDACNPTQKGKKDEIAAILGIESSGEDTVAVVNCNGGNKCKDKFDYQGYGNCKTSELLAGGSKACIVGCMGRNTCAGECKYDAISDKGGDGHAFVDDMKCTSCGACIAACPKKIISRIPKRAKVYIACSNHCKGKDITEVCSAGCIACGLCQKACQFDAVKLVDNLPVFDYSKCTACMACVEKCPKKVILCKV